MRAARLLIRRPLAASSAVLLAVLLLLPAVPPGDVVRAQVNWDAWRSRPAEPAAYPDLLVEPDALAAVLAGAEATVVDARPLARFAAGRIPGARHVDARTPPVEPDSLAAWFARAGIGDTHPIVIYADAADPAAAGRLFWLLELAGHAGVRVLQGGLEAWYRAGGPSERGPAVRPEPAAFTARPDTSRLATTTWLLGAFGERGPNVLDWRQPKTWSRGHVPHSLPFDLTLLVDEAGALLAGPKIRAILGDWGPRTGEQVDLAHGLVVLGEAPPGALPVHPYLAARAAGLAEVRVHPGGMDAWRAAGGPIVEILSTAAVGDSLRARWPRGRLRDEPPPGLVLLDMRTERDFALGHLPGAVLLPTHRFEADLHAVLAEHWPGVDPATTPLIAYCYGPTCTRTRNGCTIAARLGFRRLYWYRDGIEGWLRSGERLAGRR